MSLIQLVVLAGVTLVLGLFVLKPILSKPLEALPALTTADGAAAQDAVPATLPIPAMPRPESPALSGEIAEGGFELPTLGVVSDFDLGDGEIGISSDPAKRLKQLIEDREDETIEILRSWMEESEETV